MRSKTGDFSERIGEVHGPPRVQYLNFCVVIQPGESLGRSRRVVLTDDQKEMMRALNEQTTESSRPILMKEGHAQLPKSPLAVKPLAATGDAKMHSIIRRILRRLRSTRGSIREFFADFDSRIVKSDGSVRPTTATMNHSMGCVSRTQFERCMFNLCQLSEQFEEADLALLFWKYEKCGERFVGQAQPCPYYARNALDRDYHTHVCVRALVVHVVSVWCVWMCVCVCVCVCGCGR
jgi:hypothetical protein